MPDFELRLSSPASVVRDADGAREGDPGIEATQAATISLSINFPNPGKRYHLGPLPLAASLRCR